LSCSKGSSASDIADLSWFWFSCFKNYRASSGIADLIPEAGERLKQDNQNQLRSAIPEAGERLKQDNSRPLLVLVVLV
jgi:hypothetical protein